MRAMATAAFPAHMHLVSSPDAEEIKQNVKQESDTLRGAMLPV
jgi:hypothetical protein